MSRYKLPLHKKIKYTIHKFIRDIKLWHSSRWQRKLFKNHPKLFRQATLPRSQSCMYYGIETGSGWRKIIEKMSDELSVRFPDVEYAQIKEKFGLLRVYLDNVKEEDRNSIDTIIAKYESFSAETCEQCGDIGKRETSDNGWISVTCEKCK